MKYFKTLALAIVAVAGSWVLWSGLAHAQQFTPNVGATKTVDGSVFSAARTVHVNGIINGDVYCVGQDVTINATVHGDVLCAGQKVTVNGTIDGSIRVTGQDLTVNAKIGRNLSLGGQTVSVDRRTTVGQDAVVAATTVDMNGYVKRDVILTGSTANVGAVVGRNLHFGGTQLNLQNSAAISGNVNYSSTKQINVADHAKVTGATVHMVPQVKHHGARIFGRSLISAVYIVIAFTVFSLFLVWFFPQQVHRVSQVAVDSLGKTILTGFVTLAVFPFLISLLAATIIGLPLAALTLLFGLIILLLSMPVAAYYFGSMIWAKSKSPVHIMLLGSLILAIVYIVPVVGALLTFIAYLIGSGALLLSAKRAMPKPNYKI